ncbi:hypothetical protein HZI73_11715 [Vallitalea pronyensis]|uniref:Uncharacterized protein n=1 Tax=Vallitalea pronyensis TaxID=1348613 RepID=A0A8J8MJP5_9FIRM|nr:hypothetical protein [Vallitalea pronyensis]QUI22914.1 hypothetical protein HZI73_11715 [Vallitalea pronyensis]
MKKINRLPVLALTVIMLFSFCLSTNPIRAHEACHQSIAYRFDPVSGEFIESTDRHLNGPSLQFDLGVLHEFSVKPSQFTDESQYKVKLISANYNEQKSKAAPYTGLKKLASIANGQIKRVASTQDLTHTSITSITKMKSSNTSFNMGLTFNKDSATKLLKDVGYNLSLASVLEQSLGKQYTFKTSYSYTEKDTTIESVSKKVEKTFEIPSLPEFSSCNSADFYLYWDHEIYDMKAEIWDANGTTDPTKGIIDAQKIYLENDGGSNKTFYCPHCDKYVPYNIGDAVYVLLYADGHHEHVSEHFYYLGKELGNYKWYKHSPETVIEYEFYYPIIKGKTFPWKLNEKSHENIIADKPLHMMLPGSEEIVYDNGKYYLLRVLESSLADSGNKTEKTQLGLPVLPGFTQEVNVNRTITLKSLRHEKVTTGHSSSSSLVSKFFSLLSIGSSTNTSSSTIKETTDITEKKMTLAEVNTYKFPSFFSNNGFSGGVIYLGKDYLTFMVKGEIIPIATDGSYNESQKTFVSFKHQEEFPKIFIDPYK